MDMCLTSRALYRGLEVLSFLAECLLRRVRSQKPVQAFSTEKSSRGKTVELGQAEIERPFELVFSSSCTVAGT